MTVNLFDANFYRSVNPDLASLNDVEALSHFQNVGLNEGRNFSPFADLNFYRSSNSDISNFNNSQAFNHLQNSGVAEGRRFSEFIDLNFYKTANSDLASFNNSQALQHLEINGLNEGRRFSPFVDLNFYKTANSDLASLNNSQALQHLEVQGLDERRSFSQFFDINYYRANNQDLGQESSLNPSQLLENFEISGLNKGRVFSVPFDVNYYRSVNSDLASAGFNNQQFYEHFQLYGLIPIRQKGATDDHMEKISRNACLGIADVRCVCLEMKESVEVKQMLLVEKVASIKEKVQLLYLLKTGYAKTVTSAAQLLGRNRSKVQQWLQVYRSQGREGLLKQKHSPGRPRAIPNWAEKALSQQLQKQEGFNDYQEIVDWLQQNLGINAKYKTVYKLVHYRLESSPKVPRPQSVEQSQEQVEAFKKTLPQI